MLKMVIMFKQNIVILSLLCTSIVCRAQVGEHRNTFSLGFNGGMNLTTVGFTPKVEQNMKSGLTGGLSVRYTVEKYFSTIASIAAEVNYSQLGWDENIKTIDNSSVINPTTGIAEQYSRTINYIQIPVMAHLAWGREDNGLNFFVNAGPQFGVMLSESTQSNFTFSERNTTDRVSTVVAQDTMAVENKLDYGIMAGIGLEYSNTKVGRFLLEARYYYGLGNIYGDSKRDYFGSSRFGTITFKLTYLFDLTRYRRRVSGKG